MDSNVARASAVTVLAAGLGIGGLAVVHNSQWHDQHGKIVIAAGNSQYFDLATQYKEDLRKFGVEVEVRRTTRFKDKQGRSTLRPLEGRLTLRALIDDNSGITAAFVKGDLVGSLQGRLASEKQKGRHAEYSKLRSVGRLFHEPVWVFTRGDLPIATLRDLKGKRILIGARDSGARGIARQLLNANGVIGNVATYIDEDLPADAGPLLSGAADAAIIVVAADTDKIQQLLRVPNIRLMDFTPEAEAYTNRFPALTKVVLRQGAVEFDPLLPTDDITLLSTTVALVVRPDMQPALVSLLTHAVVHNPKSGFDKHGDPVLFYRAGEFPSSNDPEFEVANRGPRRLQVGRAADHSEDAGAESLQCGHPVLLHGLHQHALDDAGGHTRRAGDPVAADAGAAGSLCLDGSPAAGLLVPPAQGAGAQYRQRQRRCRGSSDRVRAHQLARPAHPRAALLLEPALRLARTHRSGSPAPRGEADADQDGCRVARLNLRVREAFSFK